MKPQRITRRTIVLLLLLLFAIALTVLPACNPPIVFKVENRTNDVLHVYAFRSPEGEVSPGETIEISILHRATRYLLEAENEHGEVVYSKEFSVYQLRGSHIVVDSTE